MYNKIIEYSLINKDTDNRLEAEFWVANVSFSGFKGIDVLTFSQYGTSRALNEEFDGYPVLRLNEYDGYFVSKPKKYCKYLSAFDFKALKLKKDDVLICRTNGNRDYVGKAALVTKNTEYAFASYLYRVNTDWSKIRPATLVAFLNSKYGRSEINKYSMLSNQCNFSPAKFRQINIPVLSKKINTEICKLMYDASKYVDKANLLFKRSMDLLNKYLPNIQDKNKFSQFCTKSFSFVEKNERVDAEYYYSKYEYIEKYFYKKSKTLFHNNISILDDNFFPRRELKYKYIELANINNYGEISSFTEDYGINLPTRARRIVNQGDLIVSRLEGSLDSCAVIPEELDGSLCSNGFLVIRPGNTDESFMLFCLFKSEIFQDLIRKRCTGSIMQSITTKDALTLPLPKINKIDKKNIIELVKESLRLRYLSSSLTKRASKAVEIALESNEHDALQYINKT